MNPWDGQPRIASNRNPITVAIAGAIVALVAAASAVLACTNPADPATDTATPAGGAVATTPTVTPYIAPTLTPTPTATAASSPTATPTPTATPVPPIYVATALTAESVSTTDGQVELVLTLGIENIGGPVVEEMLAVDVGFRIDEIEDSLALSIPAADEIAHEFRVSVPPGAVRFDIEIHGESFPFDAVAKAADLEIVNTQWEAVSEGRIAVDVTLRNSGNAEAEAVTVAGSVTTSDGSVTEGEGQTSLIPIGEGRTVQVLIDVPAGQHDLRLQVTTYSPEADLGDNEAFIEADVAFVAISYDYSFTPGGYWSDGTANVDLTVTASNNGIGAFTDTAEVAYSCTGAGSGDDVTTGKFEFALPDGSTSTTRSVTLRSSPGTVECRFISQEQGTQTHGHKVPAKIVGVSREVWECYSDDTINRHEDIGCAAHHYESIAKWDIDRPMKVWATGDPEYVDVLWATLDRLSPIFDMTFTGVQSEVDADLKAWVGIPRAEGPEDLRSGNCVDAAGCAPTSVSNNYAVDGASIGVWTVEDDWLHRAGLLDRRIEHVMLHELLHALMPMGHRDDPLSAVNNINAPDWIELDPLEEELIHLHRNRLIRPGMAIEEVRALIVLEDELLDAPADRDESLTPIKMLREAFTTLQNADSATWSLEGGWSANCAEHSFGRGDYTIAGFNSFGADLTRFFGGSDTILHFYDDDWSREDGGWVKDSPDIWDETNWEPSFADIHILLVSALYHASNDDISVESTVLGETTLRFTLNDTTLPKPDWYQSARLEGHVTINDLTLEITAYEMDWHFNTIRDNSCDRYEVRASQGQYGVRIDVPDAVYSGTTDDMREAIDRVNGQR